MEWLRSHDYPISTRMILRFESKETERRITSKQFIFEPMAANGDKVLEEMGS